ADVSSGLIRADINLRLLARPLKVQKSASVRIWIGDSDLCAVPSRSLVIRSVRIDGVESVKAVRKGNTLPCDIIRDTAPGLPDPTQTSTAEGPARQQPLTVLVCLSRR